MFGCKPKTHRQASSIKRSSHGRVRRGVLYFVLVSNASNLSQVHTGVYRTYVCMVNINAYYSRIAGWYAMVWYAMDRVKGAVNVNPARHGQLNRENKVIFFVCPRSRLIIWSRETVSAVPSRVSPLSPCHVSMPCVHVMSCLTCRTSLRRPRADTE